MPSPHSTSDVLGLIRRSGLLDEQRLTDVLTSVDPADESGQSILTRLVEQGSLTSWQADQLRSGRSKGFFLGKYKILAKLGHGGMSHVYLAEHLEMGRRVAIKVLTGPLAQRQDYRDRFRQEARAAALADHPNLVRAFDVDHEGDVHYLVMEYIEGIDLERTVTGSGPLDCRVAADYIRQAATGLEYAHKAGLVHRDIKPANLLVDQQGTVKIVDLGLARLSEELTNPLASSSKDQLLGTVDYLSPEQSLDSHNVTHQADIYSLGCTLYYLLTARPPFPTGTLAERLHGHRSKEPESILALRPDAAPALVAICQRMMAKKPAERYESAQEVVDILGNWLDGKLSRMFAHLALQRTPDRPPSSSAANDEELTLVPLDEETKKVAVAAKAPQPSEVEPGTLSKDQPVDQGEKKHTAVMPDEETLDADEAPLISELLEELAADETHSGAISELPPTMLRSPSSFKSPKPEIAFPLWLQAVVGAALLVVIALIWLVLSSLSR